MNFRADGGCAKSLNSGQICRHSDCTGRSLPRKISDAVTGGFHVAAWSPRRRPALLLLLGLTLPAFAQYELPPTSETIDVSIINVDVFVTDKNGNRVYGLTAGDFELRENGKPQAISNFAEYAPETRRADGTIVVEGAPAEATSQSGVSAAPQSKRTIVIFIDLVPQPTARIREVFASLREFVKNAVRPGDAATVVAFDTRLFTRQAFTDDTNALNAALSRLEDESIGVAPSAIESVRRAAAADENAKLMAAGFSKGGSTDVANTAALEREAAELFELVDMRRKTAALTSLMEGLSGVEGKKIMVMALHNFGLRPGFSSYAETARPLFPLDLRVERLRQSVMRTANANGVTLYPIHPGGHRLDESGHRAGGAAERHENGLRHGRLPRRREQRHADESDGVADRDRERDRRPDGRRPAGHRRPAAARGRRSRVVLLARVSRHADRKRCAAESGRDGEEPRLPGALAPRRRREIGRHADG